MNKIDKIFCISLPDCQPRINAMTDQMKESGLIGKTVFVNAHTVDSPLVHSCIMEKKAFHDPKSAAKLNFVSQVAISLSHYECWKRIESTKMTFGCIIEDDVRLGPNFCKKLESSLTPEIIQKMESDPCILWLTGLSSLKYASKVDKYAFRHIGPQYGNCMYIINAKLAKILMDNFFPIKMPSDDYVKNLIMAKKIHNLSMTPPIAYDLSSEYYKIYWTPKDIELKKAIRRTSNIIHISDFIRKKSDVKV